MNKQEQQQQIDLYTWFRLEVALKSYLKQKVKILPTWAPRKKIASSLEDLHSIYMDRLVFEYNVIKTMGFCGYFLIISDAIDYCKEKRIPVGPGRGSAAGSLVAFLLRITKMDPIRYNLLFERFLNPERISMPDIDTDYSQRLRHLIKEHFVAKYGVDRTASIGTFSRMKVRAGVKDVVRSLNLGGSTHESFKLADKISKTLIEEDPDIEYLDALKVPAFKAYMDQYPIMAIHLEKCEDVLRQTSMHAAGVLISEDPLNEEIPLMVDKNHMVVTAYDGKTVENQGYLKLDTLGLKNLDTIEDCFANIKKTRGLTFKLIEYHEPIPYIENESVVDFEKRLLHESDDVKYASRTFKYLREGTSTLGIFQCDQPITQDLLRRINVNSLEEIADILALIRPGPRKAGSTEFYIARKLGAPIEYLVKDRLISTLTKLNDYMPFAEWEEQATEKAQALHTFLSEMSAKQLEEIITADEEYIETLKLAPNIRDDDGVNLMYGHPSDNDLLMSAPAIQTFIAVARTYLDHKKDPSKPHSPFRGFDISCIRDICDETQGLPLFQEQLMKISMLCANFTKGDADKLRKGVGKKDAKIIKEIGAKFQKGLIAGGAPLNKEGLTPDAARYVWVKLILPYGSYGFNLSHSIAYGKVSYDTAWLKANFPGEFYASLLSHEADQDSANKIISEAKAEGIAFLLPNVNTSTNTFEVVDSKNIIYSLSCMKGVGEQAVEKIIESRPFTSLVDFIGRSNVNSAVTSVLIKAGAFDAAFPEEKVSRKNYFDFYEDCRTKLNRQIDRLLRERLQRKFNFIPKKAGGEFTPAEFHKYMLANNEDYKTLYKDWEDAEVRDFKYDWENPLTEGRGGTTITAVPRISNDERSDWTMEEHLDFEEEIFGATLSANRLDLFIEYEERFLSAASTNGMNVIRLSDDLSHYSKNDEVFVFCYLTKRTMKSPYSKDKTQYIRMFEIADRTGTSKITIFDKSYISLTKKSIPNPFTLLDFDQEKNKEKTKFKPVVLLKLRINEYNGTKGFLFDALVKWYNENQIKEIIAASKREELEEIQNRKLQKQEEV